MRSEVSVSFKDSPPVRLDLNEVQPMPHDVARGGWTTSSRKWAASRCGPPASC
jgi:hypothetical protein